MRPSRTSSMTRRFLRLFGPGFVTGASDDDPSGILTYAQTGAQFGYRQLWTVVLSVPFMIAIQEMCGRIGMVTGKGLAGVIRKSYGSRVLIIVVPLLFVANTVNIGANLGAMASSAELLLPAVPLYAWLLAMALTTLCLEIFIPYPTYARYLKYLTFSLFAYLIAGFLVRQDWTAILLSAVLPSLSADPAVLMNVVAIFGTTISPYLFFWQADEEVEEEVAQGKLRAMGVGIPRVTRRDITRMRMDTVIGMVFSNLISFFIIMTAASTLHASGVTIIGSAAEGAQALEPLAGPLAALLFSMGIIGTGLLAVPVLAGSASYAVAESLGWREGLSHSWREARGFYSVIALSTFLGILLNLAGVAPFRMLYYSAVLNGLIAPVLILAILRIANDRRIMGSYRNSARSNVPGIVITLFMGGCGVALVGQLLF